MGTPKFFNFRGEEKRRQPQRTMVSLLLQARFDEGADCNKIKVGE